MEDQRFGPITLTKEERVRELMKEVREWSERVIRLSRRAVISKDTPIADMVTALTAHGCRDLTNEIVPNSCTQYPVSGGGYSDIYRGLMKPQSHVAIKALRVSIEPNDVPGSIPKRAARELYTWSKCFHPNVLPLLGLVVFQDQIRMVSAWMNNADLPGYLRRNPRVDIYATCAQVCEGMKYLHQVPMVHGDMKGHNVVVSDEGIPMITDFGNAVLQHGELQFTQTKNMKGFSVRWTAPELLVDDDITQSKEADVYALGMTILELVTGDVPYAEHIHEIKLLFKIGTTKLLPERPELYIPRTPRGEAVWSLLLSCWHGEPNERASANEVAKMMEQIAGEK